MLKLGFPLSLIAAAALTACMARERVVQPVIVTPPATSVAVAPAGTTPSTGVTQAAPSLRAGIGRIESIGPVPQWSASTGGGQSSSMRRVGIRMDDGTLQFIDTDAPSLRVGDRIEITASGFIRQPAQ